MLTAPVPRVAASEAALTIRVLISGGVARKDVIIQAFIERDSRNRAVTFVVDSAQFYRSSTSDLEGERAPRTKEARFKDVPSGNYSVVVKLMGSSGERAQSVSSVAF